MSALLSQYSDTFRPYGIALAIVLTIWVVLGAVWHYANVWRESRGEPKLALEPTHLIAFGFIIVAAGFIWQATISNGRNDPLLAKKIDAIQATLEKFVKPRELTADQVDAISKFLLPRGHHTVRIYFAPTNEANSYAGQIYQGFKAADWDIPDKGIAALSSKPDLPNHEGVGVYAALPVGATGSGKPYDLAMEALTKAHIVYRASGSVRSETGSEYVIIVVGRRETR